MTNKMILKNSTFWIFMAITFLCLLAYQFVGIYIFVPVIVLSSTFFAIACLNDKMIILTRIFPVIIFIAVILITRSLTSALITLLLFLPAGTAISLVLKKSSSFKTLSGIVFLSLLAFFIILICSSVLEYERSFDFRSYFSVFTNEYKEILRSVYDSLSQSKIYGSALTTKADFVYLLFIQTIQVIPSLIIIVFAVASILIYWCTKYVFRLPSLKSISPSFTEYTDIRAGKPAAIIYMVVSLISMFTLSSGEIVFFNTLTYILSMYFCYTGTACIGYFIKSRNLPAILRILVYILIAIICFLPFGLSVFVSIFGVADTFLDLRRFMKERSDSRYL